MSISKDTKLRVTIALTSESAAEELLEAIQEGSNDDLADNFAKKDLSNLAATSIPAGVNLESLSTSQSSLTSFKLKTKDQTTSVSGRIDIISGSAASSFSTGSVNLFSGGTGTASGAGSTTVITGSTSVSSGSILGGTRGSTGSGNIRSGNIFISTPDTAYTGNTGNVVMVAGNTQCSATGSTITGNGGNAVIGSGGLTAVAGSVIGNSGSVSVSSGIILSNLTGSVTGNTGAARFGTGNIQGSSTTIGNTGNTELYSGPVWNLTNVGNTGSVDIYTGNNSGVGNTGNVNIYTGQPFGGGSRGSIFLNGQGTHISLRNYDVTGDHSLFVISNDSPGGSGSIQFLTYAQGNNTMGMRIFESDPSSGFSIVGYNKLNQNGGAFNLLSTTITSNTDGIYNGGDFNIMAGGSNYIDPSLGLNVSVNSGNVNISTANGSVSGLNADANSGNINIYTGNKQGSGNRGNINLDSHTVYSNVEDSFQVLTPSSTSRVRIGNKSYGQLGGPYLYADSIASNRIFEIGSSGIVNTTPGQTIIHGASIIATDDGSYNGGEVYLRTQSEYSSLDNPVNYSYSSGSIYIETDNGIVSGVGYTNANSGNINLTTGTPQGSGTRGKITLDARVIDHNKNPSTNFVVENGLTGSRPASPVMGQMYFDTTLNKPIWYAGAGWVDALGASV